MGRDCRDDEEALGRAGLAARVLPARGRGQAVSPAERRRDARAFVLAHTARERPPLVPELELRLGAEVLPLWEAAEAWKGEDCAPPFWAFAWAGGQAIARFVLDHPELVRARRVLDFGAGSGLIAIAAARAGAATACAVDIDPLSLAACELNAEANDATIDVRCDDVVGTTLDEFDLVLAGDMFYERGPSARFWQWLCAQPRRGRPVYLGDPGRNYLPEGLELRASYPVPTTRDLEGREEWTARVWQVPG